MQYVLVKFDAGPELLQESAHGTVLRYTDLDGNTVEPPAGGSQVIDLDYAAPAWAPPTPPAPTELPPVPMQVTRFQALAALLGAGLLDTVETYMSHPDTPRVQRLAWDNALTFERDSQLVQGMGASLGLSADDLDNLFRAAGEIEV